MSTALAIIWLSRGPFRAKIPLHTNRVERALRASPLGHDGSRCERGTRVAALFSSLIESAKLCGVEPRAYLREATLRAVRNPGTATLARDLKPSGSREKTGG